MKKKIAGYMAFAVSGILLAGCAEQNEQQLQGSQIESALSESTSLEQEITESELAEQKTSENADAENKTTENKTTENKDVENKSSENRIMTGEASGNEIAESIVPTIIITSDKKEWYTEDGEQLLLEADADRVAVLGDGFEALNATLSEQWQGLREHYDELEWAREQYGYMSENDYGFTKHYISEGVGVYRLDDCVVSFCGGYEAYTGGAHGYYGYDGATFDVHSGKKLTLEDILNDAEGFYDKAVSYIIEKLEEMNDEGMLFSDYREVVETETFGETPVCWYLDNTGIVIQYGLYSVAPYVAGAPGVTLPYDEFGQYMKEEYLPSYRSLFSRVEPNEDFSKLIGENRKVMLTSVYSAGRSETEVSVVSGNAVRTVGTFGRVEDAHVIKQEDGHSFLIFCCSHAPDDFVTYVYEVTGGAVRECDRLDGAAWSGTCMGTNRIGLSMYLDVLGTYKGEMVYGLTNDGKLVQAEEIFVVNTTNWLTVIKDLPVTIDGAAATIPAGTKIRITGTDNAGKAYFQVADDNEETGLIEYVRDDGQQQLLIGGVPENEYFEMVPYHFP